jgi:hypothetical protein
MTDEPLTGEGFAHMEKNWGRAFPDKWVWAQGMRLNRKRSREPSKQNADSPEASLCTLPFVVIVNIQYN